MKNLFADFTIQLISVWFLSANGLYNDDCTTAPTPSSRKEIIPRNCVIELTRPFTSEPNAVKINFGRINPQIIVAT